MENKEMNNIKLPFELCDDVEIKSDLNETLKHNATRINKNTNEFYTATFIIYSYARNVNETYLKNETDKEKYITVAINLLNELNKCGFYVGEKWKNESKMPISNGNSKLSKYTKIINVAPSVFCISANNNKCKHCNVCYALSSERRYLNTLIFRLTQLIRFETLTAENIVNQLKRCQNKFLRINESGDIFNLNDLIKIDEIAKKLYDLRGVKTYMYTHRNDMKDEINQFQSEYLRINFSDFDFITVMTVESGHSYLFCDGNCNNCIYCKIQLNMPILNLFHGDIKGTDERDEGTKQRDEFIKNTCFEMFLSGSDVLEIRQFIKNALSLEAV